MVAIEAMIFGEGQFWLQDGNSPPPVETWDQSNGLIITAEVGAAIRTGDTWGRIKVTLDVRDNQPEGVDEPLSLAGVTVWDDIVEVSVTCQEGPLRVSDFGEGFIQTFPAIDTQGPGSYRIRVHVRGRDKPGRSEEGMPVPADEFLIVTWPAPAQLPILIRLTDRRGYGGRLSWVKRMAPSR